MIDGLRAAWDKIQEFVGEIRRLKDHDQKTDLKLERLQDQDDEQEREIGLIQRHVDLLQKEIGHHGKIQASQAQDIEALNSRIKKLESEKRGLASKLGKEKKKNERLAAAPKH